MGDTRNNVVTFLAAAGLSLAAGSLAQAAYLSLDFQSDTVGSPPAGYVVHSPAVGNANNFAIVADAGSSPADPFGGAGNKSLFTQDNLNTDSMFISWDYNNAAAPDIVDGTLKFKIYLSSSGGFTSPYANVRLGQNGSGSGSSSAILIYFSFPSGAYLNKIAIDTPSGPQILDNALNFNTDYDVAITFDSITHTLSGTLTDNSVAIPTPVPLTQGSTTSWGYSKPTLNAIDSVAFQTGTTGGVGNRVFFDNVVLDAVPEPSMLGFACLGLIAMARRRNRSA